MARSIFNWKVYRCNNRDCCQFHKPCRPELERRLAFPRCQYGLDVILAVGSMTKRSRHDFKVASKPHLTFINKSLQKEGIVVSSAGLAEIMRHYSRIVRQQPMISGRFRSHVRKRGFSVLDIYKVPRSRRSPPFWVFRDWFSKRILLAIPANFRAQTGLLQRIWQLRHATKVPMVGFVHDGNEFTEAVVTRLFSDEKSNLAYSPHVLPSEDEVAAFFNRVVPSKNWARTKYRDVRFPPRCRGLWSRAKDEPETA